MITVILRKSTIYLNDISLKVLFNFCRLFISKPDAFISFGISPGDDLLCTIIANQLRKKGYHKIWMGTCFPEIFINNPCVEKIIKQDENGKINSFMNKYLKYFKVERINPWYTCRNTITDQDIIPDKHIVYIMCEKAHVEYPDVIKPFFYLKQSEIVKGKLFNNQICIHSTGAGARLHMKTKDWFFERFKEVTLILQKDFTIIQIGSEKDELLPGVIDMRGKTTIREAAALLFNSKFFIGQVGFLMHLARSVNCKSVIIYGGRERPDQSGYDVNINLYSAVNCAPCWYWNTCSNEKQCMQLINVRDVVEACSNISLY